MREQLPCEDSHFFFSSKPLSLPRGPLPSPKQRANGKRKKKKESEACKKKKKGVRVTEGGKISDEVMTGRVVVLLHKQTKL